ncbi:MAG: S41 family peptidase [Lentimicrobiaceae bacterium]|nr:S41 family peptidase [Lentimicrobiaceae bacterium]
MKFNFPPFYFFLFFFLFSCSPKNEKKTYPANSDNTEFSKSSGIEISTLSDEQTENLVVLGKVWGFLKYYHPAIAKGNYNWDYELFRILPKILNAESKQQRDSVLINCIEKLCNFRQGKPLKENKNIVIYPDLNWIDKSDFDPKLVNLLKKVRQAKRSSEHYYIELTPFVGNPIFKNEDKYSNMSFPDVGYRLLSLFRYWNMINYYFPYKKLMDTPWEEVLPEFIPKFINAKNRFEYRLVALEMVTKINDSHAFFDGLDLYSENKIVPAEITFIGDTAVVSGFFNKDFEKSTELKKGDAILKINEKSINDIIQEREKYMPASNRGALLRDMASTLLQTDKERLKIEYSRDSKIYQTVILTRNKPFRMPDKFQKADTCFKIIDHSISYLYLGSIKNEYLPNLWNHIENTEGLIIDLRCYPKDMSVMYHLSNYLMRNSSTFVKCSYGSITHPGTFTFTPNIMVGSNNELYYKGKVTILINEITQSHAEYSTMAYNMAPNVKLFGSPTAGADGNVSYIYLPGGIKTVISGIGVYYPDGRETQRIGIIPDVEVRPTIKGIKEGRDEVLEKAIEWIKEK